MARTSAANRIAFPLKTANTDLYCCIIIVWRTRIMISGTRYKRVPCVRVYLTARHEQYHIFSLNGDGLCRNQIWDRLRELVGYTTRIKKSDTAVVPNVCHQLRRFS